MKKLLYILGLLFISGFFLTCGSMKYQKELKRTRNYNTLEERMVYIEDNYSEETDYEADGVIDYIDEEPIMVESAPRPVMATPPKEASNSGASVNRRSIASSPAPMNVVVSPVVNNGMGDLVYSVPDTMEVFLEYKIPVRIAKKISNTGITDGVGDSYIEETIRVSSKMEVILVDSSPDKAFEIKNINTSTQIIDDISYTEWLFVVKPIKPGKKTLNLVISIIQGENVKQKVYSDNIEVKNHVGKQFKGFWSTHWQWCFTTLIIPIFLYFWRKRKKEKSDD